MTQLRTRFPASIRFTTRFQTLASCAAATLALILVSVHSHAAFAASPPKKGAGQGNSASSSLESSKKVKFKEKTELNFDAANIEGQAKNPFGSMISERDQDFNKGFIKLRYHWHDQMIMSTSGLSQ